MKAMAYIVMVLLLGFTSGAFSQETAQNLPPSRQIIDEIRSHNGSPALWWTGHNGWLIKADGVLLGTDLVLEEADRINQSPITTAELASELDISIVTHEHGDHFNDQVSRTLAERSNCLFVVPKSCLAKARKLGIPENRIQVAVPGEPFEIKGVRITPMHAFHGHHHFSIHKGANMDDCGYLISMGGKTFLQPGDTFLTQDHLELQQHVDVLFFSPTEHNMHVQQSVILINALEPDYLLPQHGDTYRVTPQNKYWAHNYAEEVKTHLSRTLQERYHVLGQGERLGIK